jgi:hypothetical protein
MRLRFTIATSVTIPVHTQLPTKIHMNAGSRMTIRRKVPR